MTTVEEVRAILGADESADATIQALIDQAVAFVQQATGRYFGPPKEVEEYKIGGQRDIWLNEQPLPDPDEYDVSAMPRLVILDTWSSGDWTLMEEDQYEIIRLGARDGARIRHVTRWPKGDQDIRVTYWAGYEPGGFPADVVAYVHGWIGRRWASLGGTGGLEGETIGGYSYRMSKDGASSDPELDALLLMWKHAVFR